MIFKRRRLLNDWQPVARHKPAGGVAGVRTVIDCFGAHAFRGFPTSSVNQRSCKWINSRPLGLVHCFLAATTVCCVGFAILKLTYLNLHITHSHGSVGCCTDRLRMKFWLLAIRPNPSTDRQQILWHSKRDYVVDIYIYGKFYHEHWRGFFFPICAKYILRTRLLLRVLANPRSPSSHRFYAQCVKRRGSAQGCALVFS